jgi:hypothetical protein
MDKTTADNLLKKLVDVIAEYDGQIELINSKYTKT